MQFTKRLISAIPIAVGAIGISVSAVLAYSGWESETCGPEEVWNGESCELIWCMNSSFAFYACPIGTSKDCPAGDCEDPIE
jgi:hypothetical protein